MMNDFVLNAQEENTASNAKQESGCYTVDDLMRIFGVGRKAVYALIHKHVFPVIRFNGLGYRIPKKTFNEWLARQ